MAPTQRKAIVGVMGPGACSETTLKLAGDLGTAIAEAGHLLLTGGRDKGVMDAACKGAKSAGGTTIGVLPTDDVGGVSGERHN